MLGPYPTFYNLVRTKARFDVKWKIKEGLGPHIKLGPNWFEFSAPGNILFGYYGDEVGYTSDLLHIGAGVAQVMDVGAWAWGVGGPNNFPGLGAPKTLMDTSDDYYAVDFGIFLHQNYSGDGQLTELEFLEGLSTFKDSGKLGLVADPGDCKPSLAGHYAPNEFDYPQ
jgi:hypothetical protein